MCVLALAWRAHPRWRLVLVANRDEAHDRAAEPLHRWGDADVIAGRDVRGGGTWLAVASSGRLGAVTNVRGYGASDPSRRSRGTLVVDLVEGRGGADAMAAVNPANFLVIDRDSAFFLSNRPAIVRRDLAPGLHALSNGAFDKPLPKAARLEASLGRWLSGPTHDQARLLAVLRDAAAVDHDADDRIFVLDPTYGTRCSTLVLVSEAGAGTIVERRYDRGGARTGETRIDFEWPTIRT